MKEQESNSESAEPLSLEKARRKRATRRGSARWNIDDLPREGFRVSSFTHPTLGLAKQVLVGLSDEPSLRLELFPKDLSAQLSAKGFVLSLENLMHPVVSPEQLAPDRESLLLLGADSHTQLRLGISAQGDVNLSLSGSQLAKVLSPDKQIVPMAQIEEEDRPEQDEQVRISVSGRIGAPPVFRTSAKGVLIGRFPVAEHIADKTIWHQVLVFGARAERLRQALAKGQPVEVIGYLHERPSKTDQSKTVKEIYAALVKAEGSPQ